MIRIRSINQSISIVAGMPSLSWIIELKRLECYRFSTNKIELLDPIDISSAFTINNTTAAYTGNKSLQFQSTLTIFVDNDVNIYVSEKQVSRNNSLVPVNTIEFPRQFRVQMRTRRIIFGIWKHLVIVIFQIKIVDVLMKSVNDILTKISPNPKWCTCCTNDDINSMEYDVDDISIII